MIDNAKLIHTKLERMKREYIIKLDDNNDPSVSSLKHSYWCHIIKCHLKLIECTSRNSGRNGETNINAVQEAYAELTKGIELIKGKNKTKNKQKKAWDVDYKIRILFLKAHQDFIAGNVNTAKSQLFQTHSHYKNKDIKKNIKPAEQSIAFLNNMSCIYAINDECGSAMSLIHRALWQHSKFVDSTPLYSGDHMISYLCYNAGLYLQNLKQYSRAIDSFLCCLPVLQSKPRIWLRMAQCILAIWEPYGGFEHNKDNQPQINSLIHDIIEADSTKRGDLYLLPIGKKPLIYNNIKTRNNGDDTMKNGNINDDDHKTNEIGHILKFHERNDNDYSFPYSLYKQKQHQNESKRKKRWSKRKEKQTEFCLKTDAIINELDKQQNEKNEKNDKNNNKKTRGNKSQNNHEHKENKEQEQKNKSNRQKRLYQKEKLRKIQQKKDDDEEYKLQMRELNDMKLAIEWLKNAISLFKKMETRLYIFDHVGHMSAHLHISYCYLKLKAWKFAHIHAEQTTSIHTKQQIELQRRFPTATNNQYVGSSHITYLANLYAAEALIHLNKFNQAIIKLNPNNFPHITAQQEKLNQSHTPKSSKSSKSFSRSKETDQHESKSNSNSHKSSKNKSSSNEYKEKYQERIESEKEESESNQYLAILVNLATTYICKDALEKAHRYIHKALTINDEYYPALRMLIYLQMRMGNNAEAIKIIKYRRPIPVQQFMQPQNESYNQ